MENLSLKDLMQMLNTTDIEADLKELDRAAQEEIKEKFNGDENAYLKAHFSMLDITMQLDIMPDEIRSILLENINETDPRRKILTDNMNSPHLEDRFKYPGGYNAFVEDVNNGWFGDVIIQE